MQSAPFSIHTSSDRQEYGFFLNNAFHSSKSATHLEILSPIDKSLVGKVPVMNEEEIESCVEAAFLSQPKWGDTFIHQRIDTLIKVAALLDQHVDFFADLITLEIGKPRKEAHDEVVRTIDLIVFYAEEARRIYGETLPADAYPFVTSKKIAITKRVPLGIVFAVTPFNYPLNEVAPKLISALVMGNSVIHKPALSGTITALYFAKLFEEAGLPKGLLSVVTGSGKEIGDSLVSHKLISAINFTGSYETALHMTKKAGVKKLVFGLSGKDAAIVLPDADLDHAVSEITSGAFSYAGQRCTGIKRVIVVQDVADEFVEKLITKTQQSFVLGDPRLSDVTMGPVISEKQADFIEELTIDAVQKGAMIRFGGERRSNYITPTILDNVLPMMRIAFEEQFGPVLPVLRVSDTEEAIRLANQSEYGLQSSIFTKDLQKALGLAAQLDVAAVHINEKDARSPDHFPFTGFKHSGLGMVQGGRYLLCEMSKLKAFVFQA